MIYLLHSSVRIGTTGSNSSCHYLGYCEDGFLWERMKQHHSKTVSAKIVTAFQEAGATLYLVRVWPDGGRALERHLKSRGHYKAHCPVCQGYLAQENAVSIAVASTLTARRVKLLSRKQMREAMSSESPGTFASKPGSLAQLVMQVPNAYSASAGGLSLAIHGGHGSRVTARTKAQGAKYAGTKQPLSDTGKKEEPAVPTPGQPRLPLDFLIDPSTGERCEIGASLLIDTPF